MKNLIIFLFVLICSPAFAQDDDIQHNPGAREKIKAARAVYITQRLEFTPEEAEKFWPIYNEYTQKRIDTKLQYRIARKNGADEKTLLDLDLKIKQQQLDLEKQYSEKLLTVISAQKLIQLRQVEIDFRKLLLRQIEQRHGQGERRRLKDSNRDSDTPSGDN